MRKEHEEAAYEVKYSKQVLQKVNYTQEQIDKKIKDIVERRYISF